MTVSVDLKGKVAAITGGTRGIGRGIAEILLSAGASVVINGRNTEKGQRALAEIDAGDRAIFIAGDVTKQKDVETLISKTIKQFGRIDILV
ncbi:MAG: SDR family NAD(P)-dependent oxidoreductase, partial [Candidatus Azotimanducaceae bacterium WSBS_2022_MAG_OTU7]